MLLQLQQIRNNHDHILFLTFWQPSSTTIAELHARLLVATGISTSGKGSTALLPLGGEMHSNELVLPSSERFRLV